MFALQDRCIYDGCCRMQIQTFDYTIKIQMLQLLEDHRRRMEKISEERQQNFEAFKEKSQEIAAPVDALQVFDESSEKKSTEEHPSKGFLGDNSLKSQDIVARIDALQVFDESSEKKTTEEHPFKAFLGDNFASEVTDVKKSSETQMRKNKVVEVAQMQEFQENFVPSPVEHNLFDKRGEKIQQTVHFPIVRNLFDERFEKKLVRQKLTDLDDGSTEEKPNVIHYTGQTINRQRAAEKNPEEKALEKASRKPGLAIIRMEAIFPEKINISKTLYTPQNTILTPYRLGYNSISIPPKPNITDAEVGKKKDSATDVLKTTKAAGKGGMMPGDGDAFQYIEKASKVYGAQKEDANSNSKTRAGPASLNKPAEEGQQLVVPLGLYIADQRRPYKAVLPPEPCLANECQVLFPFDRGKHRERHDRPETTDIRESIRQQIFERNQNGWINTDSLFKGLISV